MIPPVIQILQNLIGQPINPETQYIFAGMLVLMTIFAIYGLLLTIVKGIQKIGVK